MTTDPPARPVAPVKRLMTTQRRPTHPELAVEHDRFMEMLPELMKTIPDKYVALHGGEVIAVADDEVGALTAAYRLLPGVLFLARQVTDGPIPMDRLPIVRERPGANLVDVEFPLEKLGKHPAPFLPAVVSSLISPARRSLRAQLDTGADRSLMPASLAAELDLTVMEVLEFEMADGFEAELPIYSVLIALGPFPAELVHAAASENEEVLLLGRDISNKFRILLDGPAGVVRVEQ